MLKELNKVICVKYGTCAALSVFLAIRITDVCNTKRFILLIN